MRVPSTYLDAEGKPPPKLDVDALAMFAQAWLVWGKLTKTMRAGLSSCVANRHHGVCLGWASSEPTADALERRGLVVSTGDAGYRRLTPLGLLVREAGTRSPKETS